MNNLSLVVDWHKPSQRVSSKWLLCVWSLINLTELGCNVLGYNLFFYFLLFFIFVVLRKYKPAKVVALTNFECCVNKVVLIWGLRPL